jgi:hypothetical protein
MAIIANANAPAEMMPVLKCLPRPAEGQAARCFEDAAKFHCNFYWLVLPPLVAAAALRRLQPKAA